jgi:RNase P subunit RPR2
LQSGQTRCTMLKTPTVLSKSSSAIIRAVSSDNLGQTLTVICRNCSTISRKVEESKAEISEREIFYPEIFRNT